MGNLSREDARALRSRLMRERHITLERLGRELLDFVELECLEGRDRSIALMNIQQGLFWAKHGITKKAGLNEPDEDSPDETED